MTICTHRVLIVEDEPVLAMLLQELLGGAGLEVVHVQSVAEAEQALEQQESFHLVLSDFLLPDRTGLDLADHLKEHHPALRMILITACLEPEIDEQAQANPCLVEVVRKPMDVMVLRARVQELLEEGATAC